MDPGEADGLVLLAALVSEPTLSVTRRRMNELRQNPPQVTTLTGSSSSYLSLTHLLQHRLILSLSFCASIFQLASSFLSHSVF